MFLAFTAMLGWWTAKGGWHNELIEADRAKPLLVRFQVNINTAGRLELMELPGIGEVLARRIIESRQSTGPFTRPDDLMRVRGIGPKIMERLRPCLLPMPKDDTDAD